MVFTQGAVWRSLPPETEEIPQPNEFVWRRDRLSQALDPILRRVEEQLRRGPVWILVDGPQGAGKTKLLGPALQERISALHKWTPEAMCTNLALRSRSERHALSSTDYQDLWEWYRFDYLKRLATEIITAQRTNQPSVSITHWYNRDSEGIVDETPHVVRVSPLMILEGIGALSDDVIKVLEASNVLYLGLIIDALREERYERLLTTRTYRTINEQRELMDIVERSYWQHFPALRKNASYSIFVAGDDVDVTPIV